MRESIRRVLGFVAAGVVAVALMGAEAGPSPEPALDCTAETAENRQRAMILIPEGPFWMGCNRQLDGDCERNELPQREVQLSSYWIDRTEVTMAALRCCVERQACRPPNAGGAVYTWGSEEQGSHPANGITWEAAQDYCVQQGKRLPTEAEWEKAARGGCETVSGDCRRGMRIYPWGHRMPECQPLATSYDRESGCGGSQTRPVGSNAADVSPYGVADTAGNVWEWVSDRYSSSAYADRDTEVLDPAGPEDGFNRVLRGGSFLSPPRTLRASKRYGVHPTAGGEIYGFRCARSADPPPEPPGQR